MRIRVEHPWVRIELTLRAVLADRLTRGPSDRVDRVLMARKALPAVSSSRWSD